MSSFGRTVTIQDFDRICRTCLSVGIVYPIINTLVCGLELADLLQYAVTIEVTEQDRLPPNLCVTCLNELYKFHEFKKKCLDNETILKVLVENPKSHYSEDETSCNITLVKNEQIRDDSLNDEVNIKHELLEVAENSQESALIEPEEKDSTPNHVDETKEEEFSCKICNFSFSSLVEFRHHQKSKHKLIRRKHKCPICEKEFTSRLREHMRTHTKEKPFECNQCFMRFSLKCNLKRHRMKHTGERPHICNICGKGFIQGPSLRAHLKIHESKESEDTSGPYKCNCETCGRGFKRYANFSVHCSRHRHDQQNSKGIERNQVRNYVCDICAKAYKTRNLLKTHQLTHGEKSFLCSECGKGFITKAALQSHLKVHTGEKPHLCLVCKKSFAHIGSLDSHMLVHTGIRPYKCNFCDKTFKQLSHRKYHLRTHSGERPYACSYCSKTFALKGNLTVHIRTHTGETPYVCSVCGKGFHDSSSMKKHKRNHKVVSENGEYEVSLDKMPVALDVIV